MADYALLINTMKAERWSKAGVSGGRKSDARIYRSGRSTVIITGLPAQAPLDWDLLASTAELYSDLMSTAKLPAS